MAEMWVVNASPLIALGNIGRLDLLLGPGRRIFVPPGVQAEIRRGRALDLPAELEILGSVEPVPSVVMWGLGQGETEVLSHAARHPAVEAILDDRAARRCASAHGVSTHGTIGVVVLAKLQGRVPLVRPIFEELRQRGFYVAPAVLAVALNAAGE